MSKEHGAIDKKVTYSPECIRCENDEVRPVLCGDLVPIEKCITEEALGPLALPEHVINANRIDALTIYPNIARLYLDIISDCDELESDYWAILSAFCFKETMADCFNSAEAHAMKWIQAGIIELDNDPVAAIINNLNKYFGHFRERLIENVERIKQVRAPGDIPVSKMVELHVSNFEKRQRLIGVLDATADHFIGNKPAPGYAFVGREQEKAKTEARRALKRVSRLFESLNLRKEMKAFIDGKEVEICHPESNLIFVAQKYGKRLHELHRESVDFSNTIPFKLSLFTKEKVFLGRLCVYAKQTPILDQLLSLVLHIRAGEELKLLETTNWYEKTDDQTLIDELIVYYPSLITVLEKPALDLPRSIQGWSFGSYPVDWDSDLTISQDEQERWRQWTSAAIASWIAPVMLEAEKTWLIEIISSKSGADFFDLMYALKKVCGARISSGQSKEDEKA